MRRLLDRPPADAGPDPEIQDWLESLQDVLHLQGPDRARQILRELQIHAEKAGVPLPTTAQTPHGNTIPAARQPAYPGDRALERRIKSIIRWNAMAMVHRANQADASLGGHISTYASMATLYEVGYNHFFRGRNHPSGGDMIYFQGHASPGNYGRAYVEGLLTARQLENFRRELQPGGGLSSYPHPWLMPHFWEFPTVSMGLGSLQAIYRARFLRYLENRGLKPHSDSRVWAFIGDGECDEPETLGALTLPVREKLDNLIFVINCNLQRLDGPVRGNGQVIQELEGLFRGAGWNVIKVLWGSDWDPLFARDRDGVLTRRLGQIVDGEFQKYSVEGGTYIRERFVNSDPRLVEIFASLSDKALARLRLGGHDPAKVFAAYRAAVTHRDGPTVILARTVKGYGLGHAGEAMNITHKAKHLEEADLLYFRDRFDIPLSDKDAAAARFYRPAKNSPEMEYIQERRRALGGFLPKRTVLSEALAPPPDKAFQEFRAGTGERPVSTTMAFVRILSRLLWDSQFGRQIVPIVPDEARTFGMETLFPRLGIYAPQGQLYEPVDAESLLKYREAKDGQLLEEGITEAGSMSSFIAAGTSHANHGVAMLPFFIFYSMFGFQRIGDLIWAAGDMRCRGFLVGATAGRTTLNGEGLQHQDGHSLLLAEPLPNLMVYDPAFAYELAVIIQDGIRRMYVNQEDLLYYLTVYNENYPQPAMPRGVEEGIRRGLYRYARAPIAAVGKGTGKGKGQGRKQPPPSAQAHLLGSGPLLRAAIEAQEILARKYQVAADVWSVTSYKRLHRDAAAAERWNRLHPDQPPHRSHLEETLAAESGVFVAVSDYVQALPDSLARWLPGRLVSLGTDGFGRSETRAALRDFFEIDARYVTLAALHGLAREGQIPAETVGRALVDLDLDPDKADPLLA